MAGRDSAPGHCTMATKDELKIKRAEVKRLQRNAMRKINRNKINLQRERNRKLVPVFHGLIDNMNMKQLNALEVRLRAFNARSNKIIQARNGDIITTRQVHQLRAYEKKLNDAKARRRKNYDKINMPTGLTLAEHIKQRGLTPWQESKGIGDNWGRNVSHFDSAAAVDKYINYLRKRSSKKGQREYNKKQTNDLLYLAARLQDRGLYNRITRMPAWKQAILIDDPIFNDAVSMNYDLTNSMRKKGFDSYRLDIAAQSEKLAGDIISTIEKL